MANTTKRYGGFRPLESVDPTILKTLCQNGQMYSQNSNRGGGYDQKGDSCRMQSV